ncbi:O-antigen ligase family protein [Hoeflea prorocentri]|uniref:O-antigen ligase family protein n=1 Tax=Hoeflea prorocentri TaxID=1922333 RepID=A0A9X3ZGF1_9HYPH|nr:O-antigen ligase family protein [Hoeflea prorocentri]MCY6379843.1 O-antigen ligase family protein [Hoeflea prorocentri]MDA5397643.1 O-antigen ligase family protein [Hoeflea prorocentri]
MERTGRLSRFYWDIVYRDDASASFCWACGLFAVFLLFPGGGSGGSIVGIGIWLFALLNWAFDRRGRHFDEIERPIIAAFSAYCLVMVVFAVSHHVVHGSKGGFGAVYGNLLFIFFAPVMPVLRQAVRPYWLETFFAANACGAILAVLIMVIGGPFSQELLRGALSGNPLILALGAVVSGLLCVHGLLFFKGRMRLLLAIGALAALYALVSSGSRGPLLAYCITLAAYALVMGYRYFGLRFMAVRAGIAALIVALLAVGVIKADPELTNRIELAIERISNPDGEAVGEQSISVRLALYRAGLSAFGERPLTGYGRQNVMQTAALHDPQQGARFSFSHLHNGYLTDLVASGILGLVTLLAVFLVPLYVLRKAPPVVFGALFCTVLSYMLYGMSNLLFYHDVSTLYYLSLITAFCVLARLPERGGEVY